MSLIKRNKKNRPTLNPNAKCVIALTGGIASGKSTVLKEFSKLGFAVYQTDLIAKKLMKRGQSAFNQLAKLYPSAVIKTGISISKLRKLAFKEKNVFKNLNGVLHPLVREEQQKLIDRSKKSIVFEVPLLFENKREDYYDYAITTKIDESIQKSRALQRKGMTIDKLDVIMSKQIKSDVRVEKADFAIDTSKSIKHTITQIRKILNDSNG